MIEELRIRQLTEEKEESLSPLAARSRLSRGRERPEAPDPIRTAFQRDRDRIIHCKAFRRLKHKTQVFIAPPGDHFVTRLTHTLEVAQIARTVARALALNEDLTEAIALGHDLGHTPFGHVGEEVLDELSPHGFRHNEQSLRVVDRLENERRGLNLTWEVRDGIVNHSKSRTGDILGEEWGEVGTVEGEVVKIADMVAYINHDIGDAIRAGIIRERDLPLEAVRVLGLSPSQRINTMVSDIIITSWDVRTCQRPDRIGEKRYIRMSEPVLKAAYIMNEFLFKNVYQPCSNSPQANRAREVLRLLYGYFTTHQDRVPPEFYRPGEPAGRGIVDYIAGMTDQFALRLADEIANS
ncbi:MAG: deoxyguanosinetriphosphate triphosphohydrolase [Dehalococcoidales bacterium]|nr:deoxyguanosinetriphosphate triphosphohydrolase [Dehalococcoidales bacterium]